MLRAMGTNFPFLHALPLHDNLTNEYGETARFRKVTPTIFGVNPYSILHAYCNQEHKSRISAALARAIVSFCRIWKLCWLCGLLIHLASVAHHPGPVYIPETYLNDLGTLMHKDLGQRRARRQAKLRSLETPRDVCICQNDLKLLQDEQAPHDHNVNLLDQCWKSLILEVNQIRDLKQSYLPVPGSNRGTGGAGLDGRPGGRSSRKMPSKKNQYTYNTVKRVSTSQVPENLTKLRGKIHEFFSGVADMLYLHFMASVDSQLRFTGANTVIFRNSALPGRLSFQKSSIIIHTCITQRYFGYI